MRRLAPLVPLLVLIFLSGSLTASAVDLSVRITADPSGPTTRVVLSATKSVDWKIVAVDGGIEVRLSDAAVFEPTERRVDDGILAGWKVTGDRAVLLKTGPSYRRYDTFELKNPARLILDLQGKRDREPAPPPVATRKTIVVLDPGHGGTETGATGPGGLQEKDVSLDLARRLKRVLEKDPAVAVVLTRDEDRLVPLDERTAIANHNRAALFVSIHLNAARRASAVGAETYFLASESTDDEARTLAALENRAYGTDANPVEAPKGGGEEGLDLVLWDLAQNQFLIESSRLAEAVQREMNALAGTKDRGIRQAPFRVLMGATMPAILVEVGFVSSPEEEQRFRDEGYKDRVVEAIARAIAEFRKGRSLLEGRP